MSKFTLEFEWLDPGEARGPELRATWGNLQISADNQVVTRLVDDVSRSVRNHLFLPLYPLAEWFATNWWFLLYEIENVNRLDDDGYYRRHSLRNAGEGFALPSLTIIPAGERVSVQWTPAILRSQRIEFTGYGSVVLGRDALENTLASFIEAVTRRLESNGIDDTLLQQEWAAITGSSAEEREFCAASAALGQDPYAISPSERALILNAAEGIPRTARDEFFSAASLGDLETQVRNVREALERAKANQVDMASLRAIRTEATEEKDDAPWLGGYNIAKRLRHHLGLNGSITPTTSTLMEVLRLPPGQIDSAIVGHGIGHDLFDAVTHIDRRGSAGIAIPKRGETSNRFTFCRALCEYLVSAADGTWLVTESRSDRQKRNRAFAAEFLAPANAIRARVRARMLEPEQVDEMAREFGVSTWVIRHQLDNHEIAGVLT